MLIPNTLILKCYVLMLMPKHPNTLYPMSNFYALCIMHTCYVLYLISKYYTLKPNV